MNLQANVRRASPTWTRWWKIQTFSSYYFHHLVHADDALLTFACKFI